MTTPIITTGGDDDDHKFLQRITNSLETVKDWDRNIDVLQECRSVLPWKELRDPNGKYSKPKDEDRLLESSNAIFIQRLCRWFKHDFMTWVNNPRCINCSSTTTQFKETRQPETQEEKDGGASRVEVYHCPQCDTITTFPRYNKCKMLLKTKQGRCGEYANLFGCICRSLGLETRYILDFSDHVWTEVLIADNCWIMVDSCESVINKPSMYEDGWGKGPKLSYMIGLANDHIIDVTPRYTRNFLKESFQLRRRQYTTSEDTSLKVIQQINNTLQSSLSKTKRDDLTRRYQIELLQLQYLKQATEWTKQEKYGRGRISGSLAWKQSRLEDGSGNKKEEGNDDDDKSRKQQQDEKENDDVVATFEIESFYPPITTKSISIQVYPNPTKHHNGIIVANTECAIGEPNTISVVVVDEEKNFMGCILQSKSFTSWNTVTKFINTLPSYRIVIMNGKLYDAEEKEEEKESSSKTKQKIDISRLGGWNTINQDDGILFIGQVDAYPDWTYCSTVLDDAEEIGVAKNGYSIELQVEQPPPPSQLKLSKRLRTEKQTVPQVIAGRLPESIMPLKTQLLATEEQKRIAFISFCPPPDNTSAEGGSSTRYCGYTTKPNSPVYLLDATSYPFSKMNNNKSDDNNNDDGGGWNTFHFLPSPLVPEDDNGIVSSNKSGGGVVIPNYDVPLESTFFNQSLGSQLLGQNNTTLPTSDALHNARLVGLYFSASWCGPCRQFTPMLAEMYVHLKEERPSHGLEIVFVSSDRDDNSFQNYFRSMPWQAIPFPNLGFVKNNLSMTYGVRGIPSFVILDAVSGQVVVSAEESRQEVATACRGGEASIEAMLDSWLARTPQESREILTMLELSCQEAIEGNSSKKGGDNFISENPYLVGEKKEPKQFDFQAEVKKIFEKLVSEGSDPNAAAAKAITLAAEEQKKGPQLEPGPLDGKAVRTGPPSNGEALDEAFANVMVWNEPADVSAVLSTASKYLKNANKEPWSSKFRTLKLSNKVADQISRVEGGLKLLQCLGFEVFATSQDFKATIAIAADLDEMISTIEGLLEGIADA